MRNLLTALLITIFATAVGAADIGDDGLHKTSWMRDTFKDLSEDLEEANGLGKRFAIIFEQRGCVYCTKMHNEVFPRPEISSYLLENYFVVQLNLYGDVEVIDFDGEALSEKEIAQKWGVLFTPTMLFLPEEIDAGRSAIHQAVAVMPGAFQKGTVFDMLTWVNDKHYESDRSGFQRYHSKRIQQRRDGSTD